MLLLDGKLTFEFLDNKNIKVVLSIDKANLSKSLLTSEDMEPNFRNSGIVVYLTATWFKMGNPASRKLIIFGSSYVEWTANRIVRNGTEPD